MAPAAQNSARILLVFLLVALTTACAGTPHPAPPAALSTIDPNHSGTMAPPTTGKGLIALEEARKMLGVAYRYGGSDPQGFDCSGLIHYAFSRAGVTLPRTSRDIFRNSQLVNPQERQPGDLVFFAISASKVSHVGIYAGHQHFIHAPSSGKGVCYASLDDDYWEKRLVAVGRVAAESRSNVGASDISMPDE